MSPRSEQARRGARNRRAGHDAERDQARYLRAWWPDARRRSGTGWRTPTHTAPDRGDIAGTPGLVWQIKNTRHLSDTELRRVAHEAEDQAVAAGADYALVVHRRPHVADPARWWVWLPLADLTRLTCPHAHEEHTGPASGPRWLVCLRQDALIPHLLAAGYGHPAGES